MTNIKWTNHSYSELKFDDLLKYFYQSSSVFQKQLFNV